MLTATDAPARRQRAHVLDDVGALHIFMTPYPAPSVFSVPPNDVSPPASASLALSPETSPPRLPPISAPKPPPPRPPALVAPKPLVPPLPPAVVSSAGLSPLSPVRRMPPLVSSKSEPFVISPPLIDALICAAGYHHCMLYPPSGKTRAAGRFTSLLKERRR